MRNPGMPAVLTMTDLSRSVDLVPVLAYHEVNHQSQLATHPRTMAPDCCIAPERFSQQLDILNDGGFRTPRTFSVDRGCAGSAGRDVFITFDDGHQGNYTHAFPLLQEKGFTAVFFLTTDFMGRSGMMTWGQASEMAQFGMSMQSHCVSHTPLETLSEVALYHELRDSKSRIEDAIQTEVTSLSLPHGSVHPLLRTTAHAVGYRHICTSCIGHYRPDDNDSPASIPRIPIPDNLLVQEFRDIICRHGGIVKSWRRKQVVKALMKRTIGINNYRRVYRLIYKIEA